MRDIAREVGMQAGSLYAHISSKEALLVELVEAGIDRFLAIGNKLTPSMSAETRLRFAIKAHVAIATENPESSLVVFHQWRYLSEENLARVREKRRRYQKIFEDVLNDGIKSGNFSRKVDSRTAVFSILGALNWTPEWYSRQGPAGAEEIGNRLADYLMHGLYENK